MKSKKDTDSSNIDTEEEEEAVFVNTVAKTSHTILLKPSLKPSHGGKVKNSTVILQ